MSPGFRYHFITVVAIFLSLGVGMIIGGSFLPSAIVAGLNGQLRSLNSRFTEEVAPLRQDNQRYSAAIAAVRPRVLRHALAGRRVAIMQTGDYDEATQRVETALLDAGAVVVRTMVTDAGFSRKLELVHSNVLTALRAGHPSLPEGNAGIFRILAASLAIGAQETDLSVLQDAGLTEHSGAFDGRVDAVVVVAGASLDAGGRADTLDLPLVTQLRTFPVDVALVEPSTAAISYMDRFAGVPITTVDNVETEIGAMALALALREGRGNYGVRRTATSGLLPALPPER